MNSLTILPPTEPARRNRGQSAVEFALVVPLLFVILFGIVDMSRVLQAYVAVYHAAREGARYASTGRQEPDGAGGYLSRSDSVRLQARNALAGLTLDDSAAGESQVGFYWVGISPSSGGGGGDFEEVEVRYSVFTVAPGLSNLAPHILLSSKQRVVNEHFGAIPKLDRANIPPTPVPLPTFTPMPTPTFTPMPSFTAAATLTVTGTPPTATATLSAPTATDTPTSMPGNTATPTETAMATATATAPATWTPTPTATAGPPTAPTGLKLDEATRRNSSYWNVSLSWTDNSPNETRFEVQRSEDRSSWSSIGTTAAGDTTITDPYAARGKTYYYRVRACDDSSCSTWTNDVKVVIPYH